MLSKIRASFSFHKKGYEALKLIHGSNSSVIPLYLLFSLVEALYPYLNIFIFAYLIDALLLKNFTQCSFYAIILIFSNFIFGIILDALKESTEVKGIKVTQLVSIEIRKKALELDYETLENPKVLEMINTAEYSMSHSGGFKHLLTNYGKVVQSILSIIISSILVVQLCFKVSLGDNVLINIITSAPISLLILLSFFLLVILINTKMAKYINDKSIELFDKSIQAERIAGYFFNEIILDYSKGKDIRLYNMKSLILCEIKKARTFVLNIFTSFMPFYEKQASGNALVTGIITTFSYLFVVLKVLSRAISIGGLTKYVGAISQLNGALIQLVIFNDKIRVQCTYLNHVEEFMNIKNKRTTGTIPTEKRTDNEYEIEFHNVSFSYPGSTEKSLDNISCKITLKNKIAVVGRNGAGKTTFIKLLCRLYDPTEGFITLNGIDIKKYNYKDYLNLFGVVFQDFNLFAFPLGENIASSLSPIEETVWDCLQLVGIKNRVLQMPEKLKTPLFNYDEGGVEISGGEGQKLAMARALYKDAAFVILDEPTAALDPVSEYEIYSKFDTMVKDKTSIYISHRMSSCRFCNEILVFHKGKIIQRGNHEELLMEKENTYAQLWNAQAKYYIKA